MSAKEVAAASADLQVQISRQLLALTTDWCAVQPGIPLVAGQLVQLSELSRLLDFAKGEIDDLHRAGRLAALLEGVSASPEPEERTRSSRSRSRSLRAIRDRCYHSSLLDGSDEGSTSVAESASKGVDRQGQGRSQASG